MIVHGIDIIARGRHLHLTGRFVFTDLVAARRSVAVLAAVRFGLPVVVFFDSELDELCAAMRPTAEEAGRRIMEGIAEGLQDGSE